MDIPKDTSPESIAKFQADLKGLSKKEQLQVLETLAGKFVASCDAYIDKSFDNMDAKLPTHETSKELTSTTLAKMMKPTS